MQKYIQKHWQKSGLKAAKIKFLDFCGSTFVYFQCFGKNFVLSKLAFARSVIHFHFLITCYQKLRAKLENTYQSYLDPGVPQNKQKELSKNEGKVITSSDSFYSVFSLLLKYFWRFNYLQMSQKVIKFIT